MYSKHSWIQLTLNLKVHLPLFSVLVLHVVVLFITVQCVSLLPTSDNGGLLLTSEKHMLLTHES